MSNESGNSSGVSSARARGRVIGFCKTERQWDETRDVWNGLASGHRCVLRSSDAIGTRLLLIDFASWSSLRSTVHGHVMDCEHLCVEIFAPTPLSS
ncbi:hypothetical protein DY000_02048306 [Brassica cretica]|uniref:Uncharacterized protein n=1 Tax=Brassica cretica TaxID=69181 RepID=A0ABQ7F655_BRACR|nr:hypothetical protein DY000_02048306 [Brassica cretica]